MDETSKANAKEILQQALSIYKENHRPLILTGAVTLVPLVVINALVHFWVSAPGMGILERVRTSFFLVVFVLLPTSIVANLLAQGAVLIQLNSLLKQRTIKDQASVWSLMMRRFVPLLSSSLFIAAGTAVGLLLFVVPGIWFLYRSLLVVPVTLFENKSGWDAIVRSSDLIKQSKDEARIAVFATGAIVFVIQIAADVIFPSAVAGIAADLIRVAVMPLPMIGLGLFYRCASSAAIETQI